MMRKEVSTLNTPILMMSGSTDEMDEIRGLQLGVDGYINKPFSNELFLAKLNAIMMRTQQNISTNPLTLLPGNIAINKELEHRISSNKKFAVIYLDLNNFKSYNDYYGFSRGDEVIKHTANILVKAVKEKGTINDFVGHIGGDDFVAITEIENVSSICEQIISEFDSTIPQFYNEEDRIKGYITTYNRQGELKHFNIMSISIAVVTNLKRDIKHIGEISAISAELKSYVKKLGKSAYLIDRRADIKSSL
jgi:diguanylate cyclase (GGDEF)-like protein